MNSEEYIRTDLIKRMLDSDEIYFGAGGVRRKHENGLKVSYFQMRSFLLNDKKGTFLVDVKIQN